MFDFVFKELKQIHPDAAFDHTGGYEADLELARKVGRVTILSYGITTEHEFARIQAGEIWNDRGEVQAALAMLKLVREATSPAARDVLAERTRQVATEGWTPEHDDEHANGELAGAAVTYAAYRSQVPAEQIMGNEVLETFWPFSSEWFKPKGQRRDLVRAAALLIAEIERIDRASERDAANG